MFALAAVSISTQHRASPAHLLAEVIATAGLLLVIFSLARTKRAAHAPAAVGAYIGAAYFFTSSASFANPAIRSAACSPTPSPASRPPRSRVTSSRSSSAASAPSSLIRTLYPEVTPAEAAEVVLPHEVASGLEAGAPTVVSRTCG